MFGFNNSSDLPAFDIFEKLFQIAFNCKPEGDTFVHRNSKTIKVKHLSLLFAWPGILEMQLAMLTGNDKYKKQLDNLRNLLDGKVEYPQIRDFLDNLIKPKSITTTLLKEANKAKNSGDYNKLYDLKKQMRKYHPKIFETLTLLLHPKSIHMGYNTNMGRLTYFLGNYYIFCCMIAKFIEGAKGDAYITIRDIQNVLESCKIKDQLDIYFLSKIWMDVQSAKTNEALSSPFSLNVKRRGSIVYLAEPISVPSIQLILHKIKIAKYLTYAFVERYDKSVTNLDIVGESCGLALNINPFENFQYYLWHLRLKDEISDNNKLTTAFLFLDANGQGDDILANLIIRLCQVANQSAVAMKSIIDSWEEFIDSPAGIVKSNLEKYDDWIFSLIENYEARDELFNFKAFSRIIGDIDTDLEYTVIKEVRDEYKTAKRYHIPIELKQKLLEAKAELDLFVGLVIKSTTVYEEAVLNYFNENRSKYTYLDLLEHDDIKRIIFSTEANASRNKYYP